MNDREPRPSRRESRAEVSTSPSPATETIVAISTPPGRGGIGVVRLSGRRAIAVASELFQPGRKGLDPASAAALLKVG